MRIAWQIGRAALVLSAGLLAACGQEELILPGEREAVRPANDVLAGDVAAADETDAGDGAASPADEPVPGLTLPPQRSNANWAYLNGAPTHLAEHAALGSALNRLWSVSIGEGANRRARLTSGPIVSGEAIYTIDTAAQVTAVSRSGRVLWDTDVTPEGERAAEGFGGGLTYDDGSVFVSSGFGEVLSLDAATGAIRWRAEIEAASRVAPAVSDDTIIAVGLNDVAFGIDRTTGDAVWRVAGFGEGAALVGGGTPAVRGPLVVIPFQSGAITAALTRSGRTVWTAAVSGGRRGLVRSQIADISGDPVIDNDIVYAGNQAGNMVSLDRRSGERIWTLAEGAYGPALPVGGSVFVVSDTARLLRIDAATGQIIWARPLPEYRDQARRRDAIPHFGPLLAGGRLVVASGDELLRSFDPVTGAELTALPLPGPAAAQPAIAAGVLYVLTSDGRLHAFQ